MLTLVRTTTVVAVNPATGVEQGTAFGGLGRAGPVAARGDGKLLAIADQKDASVKVFDVATRNQVGGPFTLFANVGALPLRFLDDERLMVGSAGKVAIWRFGQTAPAQVTVLSNSIGSVPAGSVQAALARSAQAGTVQAGFTPDGTQVVTSAIGDRRLLRWRAGDGHPLGRLLDDRAAPRGPVEISPDGKTAIVDRPDGSMGLFDDTTGELRATLDPAASAGGVTVWDPTGHRIASSTTDGWVTIWDVSDLNHPRPTARLKRGRSGNI
jgi:WD40 repeat protein